MWRRVGLFLLLVLVAGCGTKPSYDIRVSVSGDFVGDLQVQGSPDGHLLWVSIDEPIHSLYTAWFLDYGGAAIRVYSTAYISGKANVDICRRAHGSTRDCDEGSRGEINSVHQAVFIQPAP